MSIEYRKSIDYLMNISETNYFGILKPDECVMFKYKLELDPTFNPVQFINSPEKKSMRLIGILDEQNQEHILEFKTMASVKKCIHYLYASSHVISRRWYSKNIIN